MALGSSTTYPGNSPAGYSGETGQVGPAAHQTNLNFTSLVDFSNSPNLPDIYGGLIKRFGNRSLARFLEMTGSEFPTDSDRYTWAEEGRLHIRYEGATRATAAGAVITVTAHNVRVGNTVNLSDADGVEVRGVVTATTANNFTVAPYTAGSNGGFGTLNFGTTGNALTVRVTGSEFGKGTAGMAGAVESAFTPRSVDQVIIKENFAVSGSDATQIGWINTVNEDGSIGESLWYIQSEMDTRQRFHDYLEMELLEAVPAASGSAAATAGRGGTDGLFYTLEQRGNVFVGGFDDSTAALGRADFDIIVNQLDRQGAIAENMLFLNKAQSLNIDDILAVQSNNAGTAAWGVFNNDKDMALNLGFSAWRRGSYDFYKTDWKYLNDEVGRRGVGTTGTAAAANIQGVLVPGGSGTVYQNDDPIKRPFLHIAYRQKGAENRKMKSWVTGSVGGVYTDDNDQMRINYLSERALATTSANNFFLFKQA